MNKELLLTKAPSETGSDKNTLFSTISIGTAEMNKELLLMQIPSLLNNKSRVEPNESFKNIRTPLSCNIRNEGGNSTTEKKTNEKNSTTKKRADGSNNHNTAPCNPVSYQNGDSSVESSENTNYISRRSSSSSGSKISNTDKLMQEAIMVLQNQKIRSKVDEELFENAMNYIRSIPTDNNDKNLDDRSNEKKSTLAACKKKLKIKLPNRINRLSQNSYEDDLDALHLTRNKRTASADLLPSDSFNDGQIDMDTSSAGANLLASIRRDKCTDEQIDMDAIRKTTAATKISRGGITDITTDTEEKQPYSCNRRNNDITKEEKNSIKGRQLSSSRQLSLTRPDNKDNTMNNNSNNVDKRFHKGKITSQIKMQKPKQTLSATDEHNKNLFLLEEIRSREKINTEFSAVLYTKKYKTNVVKERRQVQIDFEMAMKEIQKSERNQNDENNKNQIKNTGTYNGNSNDKDHPHVKNIVKRASRPSLWGIVPPDLG